MSDWIELIGCCKMPDDHDVLGPDESINVIARWDNGDIEQARYHYIGMDQPVFQRMCGTNEGCAGWGGENVGHVTHWMPMPEAP